MNFWKFVKSFVLNLSHYLLCFSIINQKSNFIVKRRIFQVFKGIQSYCRTKTNKMEEFNQKLLQNLEIFDNFEILNKVVESWGFPSSYVMINKKKWEISLTSIWLILFKYFNLLLLLPFIHFLIFLYFILINYCFLLANLKYFVHCFLFYFKPLKTPL